MFEITHKVGIHSPWLLPVMNVLHNIVATKQKIR